MIRSFGNRDSERLFNRQRTRLWPGIANPARRKLEILNAARSLAELRVPPGNRLEALRGNRQGQHSIRINSQWRICFVWRQGDAFEVEIVDYH